MMNIYELTAPCHFGMEAVLKREIDDLGYDVTATENGRVTFAGDAEAIARANVWLRTAGTDSSASMMTGNAAAEYSTSAEAIALRDGLPERSGADTDLKESVLSQALYACTGWGQSTGSSLHAISAATLLLDWSNSVSAGSADPALLEDTVRSEIARLSPVQVQTLRDNWSFIYYDADTILDSFKDVESLAEDAGCLEDARKVSENKNSRKNWRAVYDAIEDALAAP